MLKIRAEQMAVFQASAERSLVLRVADHLRAVHSEWAQGLDEDSLLEMVENGIARGRRYGLTFESSLTQFVVLMVVIGPNFDEHPAVWAVLTDDSIAPNERVDGLILHLTQRDWQQARAAADPMQWFAAPVN
jgi:hypothetical protein